MISKVQVHLQVTNRAPAQTPSYIIAALKFKKNFFKLKGGEITTQDNLQEMECE